MKSKILGWCAGHDSKQINFLLCLFLLTPIRAIYILVAPLIVFWFVWKYAKEMWTIDTLIMSILFGVSSMWGVLTDSNSFKNVILSFWIVYPIFYLMTCRIKIISQSVAKNFIRTATFVVLIINFGGFIIGLVKGFHPDFMAESYGSHFAKMNGLAIINAVLLIYYLCLWWENRNKNHNSWHIFFCIFVFAIGFIFCECGLAMICMVMTMLIIMISRLSVKSVFILIVFLSISMTMVKRISRDYSYYEGNYSILTDNSVWSSNFRKIIAFTNYPMIIEDNMVNLIVGCGPGAYNSRIAFLLNNDSENPFTNCIGHSSPKYHMRYIFPLWNKSFVSIDRYNDGSRNKPFSSCLSVLAEYGIIMFFFFISFWGRFYLKYRKSKFGTCQFSLHFTTLFLFLMLLTDQWLETSEMFFLLLFMIMAKSIISEKNAKKIIVYSKVIMDKR